MQRRVCPKEWLGFIGTIEGCVGGERYRASEVRGCRLGTLYFIDVGGEASVRMFISLFYFFQMRQIIFGTLLVQQRRRFG